MKVSLYQPKQFCNSDIKMGGGAIIIVFIICICLYIVFFKIIVPGWCFIFPKIFQKPSGSVAVLNKKSDLCKYDGGILF